MFDNESLRGKWNDSMTPNLKINVKHNAKSNGEGSCEVGRGG